MNNWKLLAIIVATAAATAAAVVFLMQKQNEKQRRRFNSEEFDDYDFDDYDCSMIPDDIDEGEEFDMPADAFDDLENVTLENEAEDPAADAEETVKAADAEE